MTVGYVGPQQGVIPTPSSSQHRVGEIATNLTPYIRGDMFVSQDDEDPVIKAAREAQQRVDKIGQGVDIEEAARKRIEELNKIGQTTITAGEKVDIDQRNKLLEAVTKTDGFEKNTDGSYRLKAEKLGEEKTNAKDEAKKKASKEFNGDLKGKSYEYEYEDPGKRFLQLDGSFFVEENKKIKVTVKIDDRSVETESEVSENIDPFVVEFRNGKWAVLKDRSLPKPETKIIAKAGFTGKINPDGSIVCQQGTDTYNRVVVQKDGSLYDLDKKKIFKVDKWEDDTSGRETLDCTLIMKEKDICFLPNSDGSHSPNSQTTPGAYFITRKGGMYYTGGELKDGRKTSSVMYEVEAAGNIKSITDGTELAKINLVALQTLSSLAMKSTERGKPPDWHLKYFDSPSSFKILDFDDFTSEGREAVVISRADKDGKFIKYAFDPRSWKFRVYTSESKPDDKKTSGPIPPPPPKSRFD